MTHWTQDQWILFAFKVVLIAGIVSIIAFIVQYSRYAPWWRNEIGRTLIVKDILLVLLLVPSILSLFLHFSRLSSHIAAWIDVGLFGLLTPVMIWRIAVWARIHRRPTAPFGTERDAVP